MSDRSEIESAYALNLRNRERREYLPGFHSVPQYTAV